MLTYSTYPGLMYDPSNGHFWKLRYEGSDLVQDRRLIVMEEHVSYFCPVQRKPVRKKAAKVAWEILHRIPLSDLTVIHRNFNKDDFRASNLCAISKLDYKQYKDALMNVSGTVRLKSCPKDAFSYIVQYKKDSKIVQHRCLDIVMALRFKKKVLLQSMKILGKYALTV